MKFSRYFLLALAAVLLVSGCGKGSEPTRFTGDNTPTLDNTPPPVPEGLNVTDDPLTGQQAINWSSSTASDVAGYEIFLYDPDPERDNAFVLLYSTDGSTLNYHLDPVEQITTKYFRVRSVDATGNHSALSSTIRAELWPANRAGGDPNNPPLPTMDP